MDRDKFFQGVAEYKLLAKKEVGQNFLIDSNVAERIVSLLGVKEADSVLEIGCGAGSLSYFLSLGPAKADLIDIDDALLGKLEHDFEGNPYVHPMHGNAMRFDYSPYTKIVGNLPYYITTGILEAVLLGASRASKAVFMVQKEAAERLLSGPKSKDYGPLNVLLCLLGSLKRAFSVSRNCFAPAPHVDSTVLIYDFDLNASRRDAILAYRLASRLFLQRRKTVYNNLKSVLSDEAKAKEALEKQGIAMNARPEELTPKQYLSLAQDERIKENWR